MRNAKTWGATLFILLDNSRRIARDDDVVGERPRDHATGSDHAVPPQRRALQDNRIGTDEAAVADFDGPFSDVLHPLLRNSL